jgi:hypothetical protein
MANDLQERKGKVEAALERMEGLRESFAEIETLVLDDPGNGVTDY